MENLAFLTKTDWVSGGRDVECARKTLQGRIKNFDREVKFVVTRFFAVFTFEGSDERVSCGGDAQFG